MDQQRSLGIIQARHAIEQIVLEYARAVDSADLEGLAELLSDCKVMLPGGLILDGGQAIRAHYARTIIFYDDAEQVVEYRRGACSPRTRHVTTNLLCRFDDALAEASTECYLHVLQTLDGRSGLIAVGRYLDRFLRDGESWRMVERELVLDNGGEMRRHARR